MQSKLIVRSYFVHRGS